MRITTDTNSSTAQPQQTQYPVLVGLSEIEHWEATGDERWDEYPRLPDSEFEAIYEDNQLTP